MSVYENRMVFMREWRGQLTKAAQSLDPTDCLPQCTGNGGVIADAGLMESVTSFVRPVC
jgi:hypothetical protein